MMDHKQGTKSNFISSGTGVLYVGELKMTAMCMVSFVFIHFFFWGEAPENFKACKLTQVDGSPWQVPIIGFTNLGSVLDWFLFF